MNIFDHSLSRTALVAATENISHPVDGLTFPRTDLVRVQLVLRGNLLHSLVTSQRFQRQLGLILSCKVPALRHIRIPLKVWDTP